MIRFPAFAVLLLASPAASPPPERLPDRTLTCTLGRMTNFNPRREQRTSEIVYDGKHRFAVFLPGIAVRTSPPPDAIETAEPVDPRTRILADPDGLTKGFPARFDRVVDLWPKRVELSTVIDDPLVNVIVISDADPMARTAHILMARATDAASYDLDHLYGGDCVIGGSAGADLHDPRGRDGPANG